MSLDKVDPHVNGVVGVPSEVNHAAKLWDSFKSSVLFNDEYADVYLVVEGVRLPAHKIILASRSEYFKGLLLKMKESNVDQVELEGASMAGFKVLLEYLYTGQLSLGDIPEDVVLDVLGLCHEYQEGFEELVESICNYLKAVLDVQNVCRILDTALVLGLHSLINLCCTFGDANAVILLEHATFCNLSPAGITKLISRDSFYAEEEDIFKGVEGWIRHNNANLLQDRSRVLQYVRLPLLKSETLIETVKTTGFVSDADIFDAILLRKKDRAGLKYRGRLIPEENVAHMEHGARVLNYVTGGEAILDGNVEIYDEENGYGSYTIDMNGNEGIVIKLGQQYILNHIRMLLWDNDLRSYSYYVEVSINGKHWVQICNHSKYHCHSWQEIFFKERAVRFIKIVGTLNTDPGNKCFHLVQVEAYYTAREFAICPEFGLLSPKENVSTFEQGARVIEGTNPDELIDGKTEGYDMYHGYTSHHLPDGAIVVQLAQPYVISSMRLLLWDWGNRRYSYRIEVSTDKIGWKMVWDMSQKRCKSWQIITFSPIPVVYIRIVGTHSSTNVFRCVHLECPAQIGIDDGSTEDINLGASLESIWKMVVI